MGLRRYLDPTRKCFLRPTADSWRISPDDPGNSPHNKKKTRTTLSSLHLSFREASQRNFSENIRGAGGFDSALFFSEKNIDDIYTAGVTPHSVSVPMFSPEKSDAVGVFRVRLFQPFGLEKPPRSSGDAWAREGRGGGGTHAMHDRSSMYDLIA